MFNQTPSQNLDTFYSYLNIGPTGVEGLSVQSLAKYTIMKFRAGAIESALKANNVFVKWKMGQSDVNQKVAANLLKKVMQRAEAVMCSPALDSEKGDLRFARAVESHNEALENFYSKLAELSASSSEKTNKPM